MISVMKQDTLHYCLCTRWDITLLPLIFMQVGLRYHGAGVIVSQLLKDGLMEAVDISQLESFEAGCLFAQAEGIIPAPESCHAIAAAIREANKCKETGEEKVILFNLSGHGLIDMAHTINLSPVTS